MCKSKVVGNMFAISETTGNQQPKFQRNSQIVKVLYLEKDGTSTRTYKILFDFKKKSRGHFQTKYLSKCLFYTRNLRRMIHFIFNSSNQLIIGFSPSILHIWRPHFWYCFLYCLQQRKLCDLHNTERIHCHCQISKFTSKTVWPYMLGRIHSYAT